MEKMRKVGETEKMMKEDSTSVKQKRQKAKDGEAETHKGGMAMSGKGGQCSLDWGGGRWTTPTQGIWTLKEGKKEKGAQNLCEEDFCRHQAGRCCCEEEEVRKLDMDQEYPIPQADRENKE